MKISLCKAFTYSLALNWTNCLTERALLVVEAWAEERGRVEAASRRKTTLKRWWNMMPHTVASVSYLSWGNQNLRNKSKLINDLKMIYMYLSFRTISSWKSLLHGQAWIDEGCCSWSVVNEIQLRQRGKHTCIKFRNQNDFGKQFPRLWQDECLLASSTGRSSSKCG